MENKESLCKDFILLNLMMITLFYKIRKKIVETHDFIKVDKKLRKI